MNFLAIFIWRPMQDSLTGNLLGTFVRAAAINLPAPLRRGDLCTAR